MELASRADSFVAASSSLKELAVDVLPCLVLLCQSQSEAAGIQLSYQEEGRRHHRQQREVLKTARRPLGFRFLILDTTDAGVQVGIIPSSVAEEEENG